MSSFLTKKKDSTSFDEVWYGPLSNRTGSIHTLFRESGRRLDLMVKNKFTSAEKSRVVLVPEHKHQYGRIVQKIQYSSTDILPVERAICKRWQGLTYGTPNGNVCKNLQKENDSLQKTNR